MPPSASPKKSQSSQGEKKKEKIVKEAPLPGRDIRNFVRYSISIKHLDRGLIA
jgi:hypothetical protein